MLQVIKHASCVYYSLDGLSEHSDVGGNDEADGIHEDDDENEEELEGAVGGVMRMPSPPRQELPEPRSSDDKQTSLLDELQKEIDRLRLLSPGGQSN